jgi:hypothetical protein
VGQGSQICGHQGGLIREIPAKYSIFSVPRIPPAPDRFGGIADSLELMELVEDAGKSAKIANARATLHFAALGQNPKTP